MYIFRLGNVITITGCIGTAWAPSKGFERECRFLFSNLPPGEYTVDSSRATSDSKATTMYIKIANEYLKYYHRLHYTDGQLAMQVHYDKDYSHKNSTFEDHYNKC